LDRALGMNARHADQVGEARDEPALLIGQDDNEVLLAAALDDAAKVDAPAIAVVEAHLRVRNSHLDGPAFAVAAGLPLPDAVPRFVFPAVVVKRAIELSAR